jgi:hypothetical protein
MSAMIGNTFSLAHQNHVQTQTRVRGIGLAAALVAVIALCAVVPDAEARRRPASKASSFSANKTFGLGIMFGSPTGLSGKYYLSADTALDFGLGVNGYGYRARRGLHLHADFLWHPAVLADVGAFAMPIYFGVGGRLWDYGRYYRDDRYYNDDLALGVRVPLGIMLDFNDVPIDIFFELAFVLDFLIDHGGIGADFNGAIGIRYYFF